MASPPGTAELASQAPALASNLPAFPVAIQAPDISPFIHGNTGVPGFTTQDSGLPGPHVVLMALIHGNELAGAITLTEMLSAKFMPLCGKLTMGFGNLAAFARFDPANPLASRFVEEDLNRVWDDAQLFGVRQSLEMARARAIRPLVDTADYLLDLHSMLWPSEPLLLCGATPRGLALAQLIATPANIIADDGHAGGKRLIDYAHFSGANGHATGILVEAGQHWEAEAIAQTRASVQALLRHAGMTQGRPEPASVRYAKVVETVTARTNRFLFTRNFHGGEIIAKAGTLIAHDGDSPIHTPFNDCMLVMPSLRVSRGHTAVRLAALQ